MSAAWRYDELERLAELRDRGVLTDEEFQQQKTHVLGLPDPRAHRPAGPVKRIFATVMWFFVFWFYGFILLAVMAMPLSGGNAQGWFTVLAPASFVLALALSIAGAVTRKLPLTN